MVTGRNTRLGELVDMDNPESSNYIEQDDPSNWINNQRDFQEADLALQTVTWDDGVPAPGAELLQALGICPGYSTLHILFLLYCLRCFVISFALHFLRPPPSPVDTFEKIRCLHLLLLFFLSL